MGTSEAFNKRETNNSALKQFSSHEKGLNYTHAREVGKHRPVDTA